MESEFGGIGIQITTDDGDLRILSPCTARRPTAPDCWPATAIVEIDGNSTEGLTCRTRPSSNSRARGEPGHADRRSRRAAAERAVKSRSPANASTSTPCWAIIARPTTPGTSCSTPSSDRLRTHYRLQPRYGRRVAARPWSSCRPRSLRADPRPALRSGRAAKLGHRSQRPVHLQRADRQHQGPQHAQNVFGTPTRKAPSRAFPWSCW